MQAAFRNDVRISAILSELPLAKALVWGFLGGLVATLVMDLILMSILAAVGMSPSSCFSIVGDSVARLLSLGAIAGTDSISLGIAAHYLVGPLMGLLFGVAVTKVDALYVDSRKKALITAVLFAEILSQPLLAMAPLLLQMTASAMLLWYGGSLGMHLIWGCVLGLIWSRGLCLPVPANRK